MYFDAIKSIYITNFWIIPNIFFIFIDVCINVGGLKTDIDYGTRTIDWSFGNCESEYQNYDYGTYNQSCCFNTSPNNWVFPLVCECHNIKGDRSCDGYITINGKRYCDDFSSGYKQTFFVEANPS